MLLSQVCIYLVFFAACGPNQQICKVASWFPWFYSSGFLSPYGFFLLISWNAWALLLAPKTLLLPGVLPCSSDLLTLFQWLLGPVQLRSAGKLIASTHYCSPSPELLILEVWGEAKEPACMNSYAGDSNIGGLRDPTWEAQTCCLWQFHHFNHCQHFKWCSNLYLHTYPLLTRWE